LCCNLITSLNYKTPTEMKVTMIHATG